jgi:hypothetical protein
MLTLDYERSWTAAERLYLSDYLKSGGRGKPSATAASKYTLLEAVVRKNQRLVMGDEIEPAPALDGRVMSEAVYADHEGTDFYRRPV